MWFRDILYHSLLEAIFNHHQAERLQGRLEFAGSVSHWDREQVQETPRHPFYYLHDFSGETSHLQNRTVVERTKRGPKGIVACYLTEQPTNNFAFFWRNHVSLANLLTLSMKQTISSSAPCSSDRRGPCNMEVHLSDLSEKNHPSGRFSVWDWKNIVRVWEQVFISLKCGCFNIILFLS